jgi:hypothetical protein
MNTAGLIELNVTVPPMLERVIGYTGSGRFVALYWTPYGDEVMFDDGRYSGTGEWDGFLTFIRHPAIAPALRPYQLGDSDTEAKHTLVLDREARKLFVAPIAQANRFLEEQWPRVPKSEPLTITTEEMMQSVMNALNEENWQEVSSVIDTEKIIRHMESHYALLQKMTTWLDERK